MPGPSMANQGFGDRSRATDDYYDEIEPDDTKESAPIPDRLHQHLPGEPRYITPNPGEAKWNRYESSSDDGSRNRTSQKSAEHQSSAFGVKAYEFVTQIASSSRNPARPIGDPDDRQYDEMDHDAKLYDASRTERLLYGKAGPNKSTASEFGMVGNQIPASPRAAEDSCAGLSKLAFAFVQLPDNDFQELQSFISRYEGILNEPPNSFEEAAVKARRNNDSFHVTKCVRRAAFLHLYKSHPHQIRHFLQGLIEQKKNCLIIFYNAVNEVMARVQEEALIEPLNTSETDHNEMTNMQLQPYTGSGTLTTIPEPMPSALLSDYPDSPSNFYPHTMRARGQSLSDVTVQDISYLPPTMDKTRNHEKLDPSYHLQHGRSFFYPGKIFGILWHENVGDRGGKYTSERAKQDAKARQGGNVTNGPYEQKIYSTIRRMVVVKNREGYCISVPIATYGGQGLCKPGFKQSEIDGHAIIHEFRRRPKALHQEPHMYKQPIAVELYNRETLSDASRVHCAQYHSVQWNYKVKGIGQVHRESMPWFMAHIREEMNKFGLFS